MKTHLAFALWSWRCAAPNAISMLCWSLTAAGAAPVIDSVRLLSTEPACFEYLFTGAVSRTGEQPLLAFNHRNGHTYFVKPGEALGAYRVAAFESKTNRVYRPTLNAHLNVPVEQVTLTGAGKAVVVLEQGRRLPWPGRIAWLVRLDNGIWWNIEEQDVFFMDEQPVCVEEIDEDGVTVTAGSDLTFIPRVTPGEKTEISRVWAEQKRRADLAQEQARQRRQEAAASNAATTVVTYERGPQVEIRGPPRFFYGNEYRFPTAFTICPPVYSADGKLIYAPFVVPTRFENRWSGISMTVP